MATCLLAAGLQAQDSGFNAGLDVALPIGDFGDLFSVGFGPTVGYDKEAGDQGLLGLDASFLFMSAKEDFITKGKTLSLLGHYKYFFGGDVREGAYAMGNIGWASVSYSFELSTPLLTVSSDESLGGLSYGIGLGYYVSERIDVALRYQGIRATADGDATASSGEASSTLGMVGLRLAYGF